MQKTIFILPVAALAILIATFVVMKRRDDGLNGAGSASGVKSGEGSAGDLSELARLRKELETSLKAEEAQRKRAEAAETKLAEATAALSTSGTGAEAKKASGKRADWKTRRDSELEAKVKSMAWRKSVKGVIEYWKEVEEARAEGRAVQYTQDLVAPLTALQADIKELSKLLGLGEGEDFRIFQNELINTAWMDSFLQEVAGGTITEEQFARLRQTDVYRTDPDWVFNMTDGNSLESWKHQIEQNWIYGKETVGILTPDQHALVSKTVTPTHLLSVWAYGERTFTGTEAAQGVADFWMKSFKLPDDQRSAIDAAAADYVRRQAEIAQAVASKYGGSDSRDAAFELMIKSIEAQVAAEKKLGETLQLDPELLKKLLKGSGAVIKVVN